MLVLDPLEQGGHETTLFFRPLAPRDSEEFFADSRYGEFWVGARPTIADVESELGVRARHIDELKDVLAKDAGQVQLRVVRDADAAVAALVDEVRQQAGVTESQTEVDEALSRSLSTRRMVKDAWEVDEMRKAVAATHHGFEGIIADLPEAVRRGRGERWVEGVFGLYARHEGNGVGYDSICASGDHANTLHWIKNTGDIAPDELLLLDKSTSYLEDPEAPFDLTSPVDEPVDRCMRKRSAYSCTTSSALAPPSVSASRSESDPVRPSAASKV